MAASRLVINWIMAIRIHVSVVSGKASKSLLNQRERLSQPKVRSTIQRHCSTRNLCVLRGRFTIKRARFKTGLPYQPASRRNRRLSRRASAPGKLEINFVRACLARIERIDITFGARIVTAGPVKDNPIKGLEAGEGKIVARLKFVNGAVKWAFIDKDRPGLLCQKFLQKSPSIRLSIRRHVFPSP